MSLSRLADHLGREEYVNKVVANFAKCLTAYMAVAKKMLVTASVCSNSVCLQVCMLISSATNWLFSEPLTDTEEMGGGGVLV